MKPSGKLTIALVKWFDASYQRGERSEEDLVPRVELVSAGLLVREDDETVSIALDRCDADGLWRDIEHIPKVNIRRIKRIRVP